MPHAFPRCEQIGALLLQLLLRTATAPSPRMVAGHRYKPAAEGKAGAGAVAEGEAGAGAAAEGEAGAGAGAAAEGEGGAGAAAEGEGGWAMTAPDPTPPEPAFAHALMADPGVGGVGRFRHVGCVEAHPNVMAVLQSPSEVGCCDGYWVGGIRRGLAAYL